MSIPMEPPSPTRGNGGVSRRWPFPLPTTMCGFAPRPDGHLQATGRDARGRKQYRYHTDWTELRARAKYDCLIGFGRALPALRRRIARDLAADLPDERFAAAAAVGLLDMLALRVGNSCYAEENGSFGATTLRRRHIRLKDGVISLRFVGKGGKPVACRLKDSRLHRALQKMDDLPGGRIFGWRDEDGVARSVMSHHVNRYLSDAMGEGDFTAKTFRTWVGTLAAFRLAEDTPPEISLTSAMLAGAAAERLHNTPTISRKSYIHPEVLDLTDATARKRLSRLPKASVPGLRSGEGRLIAFLARAARRRLRQG